MKILWQLMMKVDLETFLLAECLLCRHKQKVVSFLFVSYERLVKVALNLVALALNSRQRGREGKGVVFTTTLIA